MTSALEWAVRPWGYFCVLYSDEHTTVKRLRINARSALSLQFHEHREEHWSVHMVPMLGDYFFQIGDEVLTPKQMTRYTVPRGTKHRIINDSGATLEVLEVATGHFDEDDIVRLDDRYGRT